MNNNLIQINDTKFSDNLQPCLETNETNENNLSEENKMIKYFALTTINIEYFNPNFVYYNMNNFKDSQFIEMTYRSPTIFLEGLMFETPWMQVSKSIYKINKNSNNTQKNDNSTNDNSTNDNSSNNDKYFIELSFNGYQDDPELKQFYNCFNSLDKQCSSFLNKQQKTLMLKNMNEVYCKNIKNYTNDKNEKYTYIRVKANNNLRHIIVNNINHSGPLNKVNIKDSSIKCWIICYGLWRYNNKIGMSWKVVKMNVNQYEDMTKNQYEDTTNSNLFMLDEEIEENIIPNYEIECDIYYQDTLESCRYYRNINEEDIEIHNNSVQSLGEENMNIFSSPK